MKILIWGASSSTTSINKALAEHAGERLKEAFLPDADLVVLDLNDFEMPLYSIDREKADGIPQAAHRFFDEIGSADALLISYAEHNGGFTAAFKSLFDWMSRIDKKVFQDKPIVAMATSPGGRGGKRALEDAVTLAPHFGGDIVGKLSVPRFSKAFDVAAGKLIDEALEVKLDTALNALTRRLLPVEDGQKAGGKPGPEMWDKRYSDEFAAYGTAPNAFLRAVAGRIPDGPVLVIAAGEGRDAVFLAEQGHAVTAMDQSAVGLANADTLAAQRGVSITTQVADLADYSFGESHWAGIVSVWTHLPPALREQVHAACVNALKPGGVFVLEAYAPAHLDRPGKGGPPMAAMLMTTDGLRKELAGLTFEICQQVERDVDEGAFHQGPSTTTQVIAVRPLS